MSEYFERYYPFAFGVVAAGAYLLLLRNEPFPDTTKDVLSAIISLASIAVGFLATVKAILVSIEDRPAIVWLRRGSFYKRFRAYTFQAIYASFAIAVVSVAGLLLFPKIERASWAFWVAAGYLAALVWTGASYVRVVSVFRVMLTGSDEKRTASGAATSGA